ncbi:hypothetical protein BGX33_012503 [Mortierella sp. NVP41]|nr:hypothetical protein BGX33_012503 [Mortierella sp. NVP41]
MCEYVDSSSRTDNQPDGSGSIATIATTGTSDLAETRTELTPHVGHHSGYDLARPEELFRNAKNNNNTTTTNNNEGGGLLGESGYNQ